MTGVLQCDIREQQYYLDSLEERAPQYDLTVQVEMLPVGDYICGQRLGCEYKSHNDFLGSFGERLFTQARELAANFERPVILVGSTLEDIIRDGRHPEAAVHGFVASLIVREGCAVYFCGQDPIPAILKLAQKASTETSRVYNPLRRGGSKGEFGIGLIASLPGVGMKRARKVIEHFGSPLEALVSVNEWSQIDGIGNKTVERCLEVLTEPSSTEPTSPELLLEEP